MNKEEPSEMGYYTVKEACQISGEQDATVRLAMKNGYVKWAKVSSRNYILDRESFEQWRAYRIKKKASIEVRCDALKATNKEQKLSTNVYLGYTSKDEIKKDYEEYQKAIENFVIQADKIIQNFPSISKEDILKIKKNCYSKGRKYRFYRDFYDFLLITGKIAKAFVNMVNSQKGNNGK